MRDESRRRKALHVLHRRANRSIMEATQTTAASHAVAAFAVNMRMYRSGLRKGWTAWCAFAKRRRATRLRLIEQAATKSQEMDHEKAGMWEELQRLRRALQQTQQTQFAERKSTFLQRMHIAQLVQQIERLRRSLGEQKSQARRTEADNIRHAALANDLQHFAVMLHIPYVGREDRRFIGPGDRWFVGG